MDTSKEHIDFCVKKIGEVIARKRKDLHLTQAQVAEHTDLAVNTLSCIERGEHPGSIQTIIALCQYLEVSLDSVILGSKHYGTAVFSEELEETMKQLPTEARKMVMDQN